MAEIPKLYHANSDNEATRRNITRDSSTFSTETISSNNSLPSSTVNEVSSSTCDWTRSFIDKLGIRFVCKSPNEIITEHMSTLAYNLFPEEKNDIEELADILGCLYNLNHGSLHQVNFKGLSFFALEEEKLRNNVTFKGIDISMYSTFLKKFGVSLWYVLKGKQLEISEAKYQSLFEDFLQMFGMEVMAQPEIDTESTEIFQKKVSARADIVCLSPRDVEKCSLAVCKVKKESCFADVETEPSAPKSRRTEDNPQRNQRCSERSSLPDGILPEHVGDLLAYLDKSMCKEAILGMTVEKTMVTFTRLLVMDKTMEMLQRSSCGSVKIKEDERPVLFYSKRYNYLLEEDRKEIVKTLLTLNVLEKRRAKKS